MVIPSDDVITRIRGFYTYFDVTSGTLNKLAVFQSKLLAIYAAKITYFTDTGSSPNETGTETALSGQTVAVTGTRVSRTLASNGNFYFTTDGGVLKLPAYNGTLAKSGAPQGLDITLNFLNGSNSTWFLNSTTDASIVTSTVGYRIVFGYRDTNDNLILGAPSDITTLTNTVVGDGSTTCSWARATNVVTVTSSAHGLAIGQYIYVFSSTAAGTSVTTGSYTIVSVPDADSFTFASVAADDPAGNYLKYCMAMPVRVEFSVPTEISSSLTWVYQIYRSSIVAGTAILSDFKLLEEKELTSAQITASVVYYTDDWDDVLRGAELYTNQNTREGELQANFRPPLCDDMTFYKGYSLYLNCVTRHLLNLAVVDTTSLADGDFIEVSVDSAVRRYIAKPSVANQTVRGTTTSSGGILVTYAGHGMTATETWTVYVSNAVGGTLADGIYYVIYVNSSTFRLADTVAHFTAATAVAYPGALSSINFSVIGTSATTVAAKVWTRTAGNVVTVTSNAHGLSVGMQIYGFNTSGGTFTSNVFTLTAVATNTFTFTGAGGLDATGYTLSYNLLAPCFYLNSTSGSASVRLRDTAKGIVKAINRDSGSVIYAQYASGVGEVPGKMRLQAKGFGGAVYVRANTDLAGTSYSPILPSSFTSGTQIYSRNDDLPHSFYASKLNEPEAVPLTNAFPVGSKNAELLRGHALRDSVILLKEDGVWKMTGDNPNNFSITLLDGTVKCVAASSSDVLNNQVIFLSNQGVCLVTENSVQIVSRKIEEVIQPILGQSGLAAITAAVAYETERLYMITTTEPNETTATQTYCYNVLTDAWTTADWLFTQAIIGPSDVMYYCSAAGDIMRERKKQTKIDYCGQNHAITVDAVATDTKSATITITTTEPAAGDIIVKSDVVNLITAVTINSATSYTVTFRNVSNLVLADAIYLYESYTATIKLAPFHGGLIGRNKQFTQMQLHYRDESCTRLAVTFTGYTFGGSASTDWNASLIRGSGWGNFPWGYEGWGQQGGINLISGSQAAPVCRIFIPREQQRGTYIQPILENTVAGEALNIQAVSFAVRAYGERDST